MINTVETYDGSTASKKDCRFIKGDFYIKNKQCFYIEGTWYRVNSGFITFDYETQKWVITKDTPSLVKGIVGCDSDRKEVVIGHYTPNPYNNVNVILANGVTYNCMNQNILPSDMFKEDPGRMLFVHNSIPMEKDKIPANNFSSNNYPFSLPYCTKHYPPELYKTFMEKAHTGQITTAIGSKYDQLNNYSFGFEFETTRGKIPNYKVLESGLLPLRDGSITGIEFATIPLSGKKGISTLENACDLLKRYTTFSENESLHLHLGNIPTTKKFVGYLYTICCILEKDIYSLFPKYYAQTSKFKARQKDYNMPLKKELVALTPEETFDNIAFYLSEGKKYQGFGSEHPSDPEGQSKWNIHVRYHWVNFISLLFGNNKTIEFRVHVPTRDKIKVLNWLYICAAIVKYTDKLVKNNADLNYCRSLTLSDVVKNSYDYKLGSYLNNYIRERQSKRIIDDTNGDFVGRGEITAELKGNALYKDLN